MCPPTDANYAYVPASWQRLKRVRAGAATYFGWDGDNLEAEYLNDGSQPQSFLTIGTDDELSTTRVSGTYYYLHDGLGSIRNVIDGSQVVQNTYDTRAFGQDQGAQTANITNPFRYTGAYDDYWESAQSPLYYLRNRYYTANVGLFASRDDLGYRLGRDWGYVENSPVGATDPWGRERALATATNLLGIWKYSAFFIWDCDSNTSDIVPVGFTGLRSVGVTLPVSGGVQVGVGMWMEAIPVNASYTESCCKPDGCKGHRYVVDLRIYFNVCAGIGFNCCWSAGPPLRMTVRCDCK